MSDIVQATVNGGALGAQYALMALGFSIIFGVLGVINFAHGAFFAVGGFLTYWADVTVGLPYVPALLVAVLATAALGYAFEFAILDHRVDDHLGSIVLTLGFGLCLSAGLLLLFGPDPRQFEFPVDGAVTIAGATISSGRLILVGVALVVIAAVAWLLFRTRLGVALRALADDREMARVQGMPARLLFPLAFALATALAGLTGGLVTPLYLLDPFVGDQVLLLSFVVVILGGLGSLPGAVIAAFVVGLIQSFVGVYVGGSYAPLLLFGFVLVMLVFRPTGLMGDRSVRT
jgi:branched-chain amino acid transport system permease protein